MSSRPTTSQAWCYFVTHHISSMMLLRDLSLITIMFQSVTVFLISQDTVVTLLRCGGIFSYHFIKNLLLSLSVKEFW